MKRLLVTGPRAVEFAEMPDPICPPDGLVVRATQTAISAGTELRVYRAEPVDEAGRFLHETVPFELPTENGYSMVGHVVEVGAAVSDFAVGDRVFGPAPHKQLAAIPARLAVKLPESISDEIGVFLSILEVSHIALRRGCPEPGCNVAIIGQGVIGLSALAYCRAFGMRTAVVDLSPTRLKLARRMGADLALSPEDGPVGPRVMEFFDGRGADVVLEAASNWRAVRTAMEVARVDGTVVIVSRHTRIPDFNPFGHPFLGKKLSLVTSYGHDVDGQRWDRAGSVALTLRLLRENKLSIEPMITHRHNWTELPEVYQKLDAGDPQMVGVVLRWQR